MTNYDTTGVPGTSVEITNDAAVAQVFLDALGVRDFPRLETCFHPASHLRALVPPGLRVGTGPEETVGWFKKWFSGSDHFEVIFSEVDQVSDRLHIAYRIRLHQSVRWYLVEQHVYCTVKQERIEAMDLLCSGFRPESPMSVMCQST